MAELRFLLPDNLAPANLRTNCPTNAAYQSVSFVRLLWDNDDQRRMATYKFRNPPSQGRYLPYKVILFSFSLCDNDDQRRVATSKHKKPDYLA